VVYIKINIVLPCILIKWCGISELNSGRTSSMKTKTKQVQTVNRETAINENEIKREIV